MHQIGFNFIMFLTEDLITINILLNILPQLCYISKIILHVPVFVNKNTDSHAAAVLNAKKLSISFCLLFLRIKKLKIVHH